MSSSLQRLLVSLSVAGLQKEKDVEQNVKFIAAFVVSGPRSSRASLVSMPRALHVPKTITDGMGWWSIGSAASEEYIRTCRTLIAEVQETQQKCGVLLEGIS